MSNVCFSGGAEGADILWGSQAKKHGHKVIHYSFKGHNISSFDNVEIIPQEELNKVDIFLNRANKTLNRKYPSKNNFVNNLLRRNYYQIRETERVYAISSFFGQLVIGGTAWAVQMYLDLCKDKDITPECYVFSQQEVIPQWYNWDKEKMKWNPTKPPVPFGKWTGIGSRVLMPSGVKAIKDIWNT